MSTVTRRADSLFLDRFTAWASGEKDVRGALLVGSHARSVRPADDWSDLDIMLITTHPDRYWRTAGWLRELGTVWLDYVIASPVGDRKVRHVVFDGPVVVDFAIVSSFETRWGGPVLRALASVPGAIQLLPGGLRAQVVSWFEQQRTGSPVVLFDRGGAATRLRVRRPPALPWRRPSAHEFSEAVHTFWSLAMWVGKWAARREFWMANWQAGHQLQDELLRMIEWHARAGQGSAHETWFSGRFIESWADERVVRELPRVFARYDEDDVWRALSAATQLYGWLGEQTAHRLGYQYPTASAEQVTGWLRDWQERAGGPVLAR